MLDIQILARVLKISACIKYLLYVNDNVPLLMTPLSKSI